MWKQLRSIKNEEDKREKVTWDVKACKNTKAVKQTFRIKKSFTLIASNFVREQLNNYKHRAYNVENSTSFEIGLNSTKKYYRSVLSDYPRLL